MDLLISMIAGGFAATIAGSAGAQRLWAFWRNATIGILGGALATAAQIRLGLYGLAQTSPDSASLEPLALASQLGLGALGGAGLWGVLRLFFGGLRR